MSDPFVFSKVLCSLGEGPLWSPEHRCLFWVDIDNQRVLQQGEADADTRIYEFDHPVSAFAREPSESLIVSTSRGVHRWQVGSAALDLVHPVEGDNPVTRSNDGRTDRLGGFWISTMGYNAEKEAGSLYRFGVSGLQLIKDKISIPNSICFSPQGEWAYFSDTPSGCIIRWPLDKATGLPAGEPELFVDISATGFGPDGSVVDAEGHLWNAQWGGARVVRYRPDGTQERVIELPVSQPTCPAFGGADGKTLFITTARQDLSEEQLAREPLAGATFAVKLEIEGLFDPVIERITA